MSDLDYDALTIAATGAHPRFVEEFTERRGRRSLTAWEFIDRFWARVRADGSCLLWTGAISDKGYGTVSILRKTRNAHRVVLWMKHGEQVDPALQVDHLCRVRNCVNPDHLEVVPNEVNNARSLSPTAMNARKTHCIHGHPFSGSNLKIVGKRRERRCRECDKRRLRGRNRKPMTVEQKAAKAQKERDRRARLRAALDPEEDQ